MFCRPKPTGRLLSVTVFTGTLNNRLLSVTLFTGTLNNSK